MANSASYIKRRDKRAVEAFKNASETIGTITPGMHLFAITRGQFSMIDAVLACLDQIGTARLSVWTWCTSEYEISNLASLRRGDRVTEALLVIDARAQMDNRGDVIFSEWRKTFGINSIKCVKNHAKIATLEAENFRILLRGSMNLNYNARFEQMDISEGCAGFDLVRRIEEELPVLPENASYEEFRKVTKLDEDFNLQSEITTFGGIKTWAK